MRLKKRENLKILYACESGEPGLGFSVGRQRLRYCAFVLRERDWYLRVDHEFQRDVVEEPISDLLDISGWDFKEGIEAFV